MRVPNYLNQIPVTNTLSSFRPRLLGASDTGITRAVREAVAASFQAGLVGCFIRSIDTPAWARDIAEYAWDQFKAECRHDWRAETLVPREVQGQGRGKRAVHFQHAMKLDPTILSGAQDYNNCCAWATREITGCCIAVDLLERGEAHTYTKRPGTGVTYSFRGSRSDSGMALYDAGRVVHTVGIQLEMSYLNGQYDLSNEAKDQSFGVKYGRNGAPKDLLEVIKGDLIETVANIQEEEAVLDILFSGAFILTGSTRTAGGAGDPISNAGPIGAHAQALLGYDDTEEFREWYQKATGNRLTDWVGIFDQSWFPDWIGMSNWPEHLWGPRPEGAFVLSGRDTMQMITEWGEALAMSSVKGFPLRRLPDWGTGLYL
jgi:hypothetical protein